VVLRFGELFLKGKNRYLFEQALERNVRLAVRDRDDVTVIRKHGRIFVLGASDDELLDKLESVFGVASLSPVVLCEKSLDEITRNALALAAKRPPGVRTFRISPRRSDKTFAHTSADLGRIVGAAVAQAEGLSVDLTEYDYAIGIEVGPEWTFLWPSELKGAGGLPVGTSGPAMLLLSGGIDSPVAGHLMQKRGLALSAVYFHAFPYTGDGAKDKVIRLAKILAGRQRELVVHVVPFTRVQEMFRDQAEAKLLVILYRRAMVRIAAMLAGKKKIRCLVTGESLGQVASQTVHNLAAIEDASPLPILRPLIGFDKAEIVDLARKIGSFDISVLPHDDCCSLFVPKHPETHASLRHVRKTESRIEWQPRIEEAFEETETIVL
jgi:thiamine biosynthesis protein ThiI